MFPFDRPTNYNEMLNKIGIFTFVEGLLLTWFVAHFAPPVSRALEIVKLPVSIGGLQIPFLYVVPSAIVALLARVVRLHDWISDRFRIRHTFDLYRILVPLAGSVGQSLTIDAREKLARKRKAAMQRTFYLYASFEEPKISKALVLNAIDTWTWYWILAELVCLLIIAAAVLMFFGAYAPAAWILAADCGMILLFCSAFAVCGRNADYQIQEILEDAERVKALER